MLSLNRSPDRLLAGERLDDADAGDALLQRGQVLADAVADREVCTVRVALELDADAIATNGTEIRHTIVSCHDIRISSDSEKTSSKPFETNMEQADLHELGHRVDV